MNVPFPCIGILGEPKNAGTVETVLALENYLATQHYRILIEEKLAAATHATHITTATAAIIAQRCDLAIVVGGDGSMLKASHLVTATSPPVLGINRGRLGFLTDIYPTELNSKLADVLNGNYLEEKRFLLQTDILYPHHTTHAGIALNDVVLNPGDVVSMLEFEIYLDNTFVCSQRADGLIVATPTGSTAYALSGGGPILHPSLDAMVLVPMFPHTLSSRPIVINGHHQVDIIVAPSPNYQPRISCDGQAFVPLTDSLHFRITRYPHMLRLIHPQDYDYFATLRTKLHWGTKL